MAKKSISKQLKAVTELVANQISVKEERKATLQNQIAGAEGSHKRSLQSLQSDCNRSLRMLYAFRYILENGIDDTAAEKIMVAVNAQEIPFTDGENVLDVLRRTNWSPITLDKNLEKFGYKLDGMTIRKA